jgi:hypothetical protein
MKPNALQRNKKRLKEQMAVSLLNAESTERESLIAVTEMIVRRLNSMLMSQRDNSMNT